VQILLGRDEVDPDEPDNDSRSRVQLGADTRVVRILFEREEVNSDKPDKYGRTPLSYAAWGGHEGVVKMLLGRADY